MGLMSMPREVNTTIPYLQPDPKGATVLYASYFRKAQLTALQMLVEYHVILTNTPIVVFVC
jgi:hypothetical protein